ncbi:MAG TPA: cysteine desulfurase family protein [Candidatus Nanopelagicaceae bacterium]|jgi:cysteine desulfurase
MPRVYFDNAATSPINEVALQALLEQARATGNPSSLHSYGREARRNVEEARERIAALVECEPSEVIFTGSGTEANNLAIKGIYWHRLSENKKRKVIITSTFEHHAILDPIRWLAESEGAEIIEVPVDSSGYLKLDYLETALENRGTEVSLISVMHSNNEVGTIQPITEIVRLAKKYDIPVHSDAIQSFGKIPLSYAELGLFALTISAHKLGGPIGVGALILKKGFDITPLLHGGGQERDIRSGTINAPAIVAFSLAAQAAHRNREKNSIYVSALRESLLDTIKNDIPDAVLNGGPGERLPGILNVRFPNTESDSLLLLFDSEGIACSTGSACTAGVQQASHVLMAMGLSEAEARSSLRFSLSPENSKGDIDYFHTCLKRVIERARAAYRSSA